MPKKTYRRSGKKQKRSRKNRRTRRQVGGALVNSLNFINNATGNQMYSVSVTNDHANIYTDNDNAKIKEEIEKIIKNRPDLGFQDKTITRAKEEAPRILVYMGPK